MNESTGDRIQNSGDCKDNRDKIQCHRECQVTANREHHSSREKQKMRKLADLIVDKRNIRSIDRDVTSNSTHRNSDMSFFQRRRIVDSISNHADRMT